METRKKIITFINEMNGGGAQRVLSHLMNSWADKGHEVVVITISDEPSFYSLRKNIQWISLRDAGPAHNTFSAIFVSARRILRLRKLLKEHKPAAALAFMPSANVQLALASLGLPHKAVGSERVYPPYAGLTPLWERARSLTYRFLDTVVVQTEDAADWLQDNVKTKDIVVIPNSVMLLPQSYVEANEKITNQENKHMILAVGRLVPQKGFDILIKAFAQVASEYPDWQLYIAGEGADRKELENTIESKGLLDRVKLLGQVSDIENYYQSASLFVMSSRFEGFPNALAEAMVYGLPVISFDCQTGPRELIRHEVDGILLPAEDEAALIAALKKLMNNQVLRKDLGSRAVEVKERFSFEKIDAVYQEILRLKDN